MAEEKKPPKGKGARYVETFNPEKYLVEIPSRTNPGEMEKYLMVQWRKMWMLEYNPNWAMVTEHQIHPDLRMIVATTSIFDENGKLRSTGSASIYLEDANGKRVETPLELAETRAQGRALGNAGFGTQYALPGNAPEDKDILAEAPIGLPNLRERGSKTGEIPKLEAKEGADATGTEVPKEAPRRGRKPGSKRPENAELENEGIEGQESMLPADNAEAPKTSEPQTKTKAETGLITTEEEAKAYVIPIGTEKGKYMGEVLVMNKNALLFYAEKYHGSDVNLRRAARILLKLPLED